MIPTRKEKGCIGESTVLADELRVLSNARARFGSKLSVEEIGGDKSALCLSGGGIRSAIFSLGGLMALDRGRLIQHFDYLSTVSGGGYIGSWLSKLLKVLGDDHVQSDTPIFDSVRSREKDLQAFDNSDRSPFEPAALQFLRENSSYLTPKKGMLSGDTWAILAIYLRNLLLNWIILLPFLSAVLVGPLCVVGILMSFVNAQEAAVLAGIFGIIALYYPTWVPALEDVTQDQSQRSSQKAHPQDEEPGPEVENRHFRQMSVTSFLWQRLLPYAIAILFFTHWVFIQSRQDPGALRHLGGGAGAVVCLGFGVPFIVLLVAAIVVSITPVGVLERRMQPSRARWTFFAQTLGSLCAIPGTALLVQFVPGIVKDSLWFYVWFPVAGTIVFLIAGALFAGLVDPLVQDDNREWWARSAGYFLLFAAAWAIFGAVSLGIPSWLHLARVPAGGGLALLNRVEYPSYWDASRTVLATLVCGTVAYYARIEKEISAAARRWQFIAEWSKRIVFVIAIAIFSIFLAEILIVLTTDLAALISFRWSPNELSVAWPFLLAAAVAVFLISIIASIPVNINRFSAHIAYRNRLVRTFLGASNLRRRYNPFTGFSQTDNVPLYLLLSKQINQTAIKRAAEGDRPHIATPSQRPFHVLCGTINMARGERLAWQERQAVSFTFSGLYCGGRDFGYRRSDYYGGPRGISLGTAMAISGAAANSGMGFYSSPLKSFLLTLLNARLGWWLGNPRCDPQSRRESPLFAFNPLLRELFSLTGITYCWLNASDGGHFDNTGVYEMLRRKCKWILLFDAETNRKGISNAARRARVDLNVDLTLIAKGKNSFPCDYYTISYKRNDGNAVKGALLRVFPSVVDECAWTGFENWFYKSVNRAFPDDPLLNQFFSETAFESYRLLGLGTVGEVFARERALAGEGQPDMERLFQACLDNLSKFSWIESTDNQNPPGYSGGTGGPLSRQSSPLETPNLSD